MFWFIFDNLWSRLVSSDQIFNGFSSEELGDFLMVDWIEIQECQPEFDLACFWEGCRSPERVLLDRRSQVPVLERSSGWGRTFFCSMQRGGPCPVAGRRDLGRDSWFFTPPYLLTKGTLFGMRRTTRSGLALRIHKCDLFLWSRRQSRALFLRSGGEVCSMIFRKIEMVMIRLQRILV